MAARVAAIVLAAGGSSRMAPRNKLLLRDADGMTMVGRVVAACLGSRVAEVIVVTGHAADQVAQAVLDAAPNGPARCVHASDHALGQSASLRAGLAAVPEQADAALICLGDMPLVTSYIIDRLLHAADRAAGEPIVAPACGGRRGNPVLWPRRFWPAIAAVTGDTGARGLLAEHAASLLEIDVDDPAVLRDFDTPESLLAGF